ncbi:MAG: hypothetical protein JWP10_418 [Nocardioidaceae bacterium]|nr:hypothetical protein [Nocardioidaceae bacterium]
MPNMTSTLSYLSLPETSKRFPEPRATVVTTYPEPRLAS